jgi:hypothetical protein
VSSLRLVLPGREMVVTRLLRRVALALALGAGCTGEIADSPLTAGPFMPHVQSSSVALAEGSGFADERGGGVFVAAEGKVVRLRLDGTAGRLDSHPGNARAPGKVLRVFSAGPFSALVAADNGLYVAESGWLIEPSWRDALDAPGIVGVAPDLDGVTWIAHQRGLFRIEAGQLSELKVEGAPVLGLTALAVAPAPDGGRAVWFAQATQLSYAKQTARARYEVSSGGIAASELAGGIKALAGIGASPASAGELWLITDQKLYQQAGHGWRARALPAAPSALLASGRFAWLRAGDTLYRYRADDERWSHVDGLSAPATPLAAEPGGSLWARVGEQTVTIAPGVLPRVLGLFEGVRIYQTELPVRAQFSSTAMPTGVSFVLDDGERVERSLSEGQPGEGGASTLDFAWGGFDVAGREKPYSLVGLSNGLHTLRVEAHFVDGDQTRTLHFEFRGGAAEQLSFARDVLPIAEARCAKCHTSGPGHALSSYAQWLAEKDELVLALVEQRMPADGPLAASELQTIQRWAYGGAAP